MSEEQNPTPAGAPTDGVSKRPRLLAGAPTDSVSRPRALAAGGASLGSLKVAMTPQQLAAIEKAKQAQAEAEAAEQARLEAEAKYLEELRIYQEYQAAEQARKEEEARIAQEEQAIAEAEALRLAEEAKLAEQLAQQSQSAESQALAEEAARQLAAAQELMEKAKAMQQQVAQAQTPTPSIPTPSIPMPSLSSPTAPIPSPTGMPTSAPSAFGINTPQDDSTIPGAPTAGVSAALRKPLSPSMTLVKDNSTPLWKNKVVLGIAGVIVIGMSTWAYMEWDKNKTIERENARYVQLIKEGTNPDIEILAGMHPADVDLILTRFKTEREPTNWKAGARTLKKICDGNADLAVRIMDDIAKNPKSYTYDKKRRMLFFMVGVKNPPSDLKDRMLALFNNSQDDIKPDIIWYMYPLLGDEDIPMLIDIINDPKAEGKLATNAESTASKVIAKSPNKSALTQEIQKQYDAADDLKKNVYIRLMGKTGDAAGLDFLKKIVLDPNSSVPSKRNALKALGGWANDDAIPLLLEVVKSPFGQNKETSAYVSDELYITLAKPGRKRDQAKFKPLIDHLIAQNKTDTDKIRFIAALKANSKVDQWAIDLLKGFETDISNKVSFEAERALEDLMKREDPNKKPEKKKAKSSEDDEELESAPAEA